MWSATSETPSAPAHAARRSAGEQLAAQNRRERLRLDIGAGPGRDVLGGSVGHLGRQPAELHGEVRTVARGIDAGNAAHGAVVIDGEEAMLVLRRRLRSAVPQVAEARRCARLRARRGPCRLP